MNININSDADLMLYWLSHHGIVPKRKLDERWRKFRGKSNCNWLLKQLQYLGHVELFDCPNKKGTLEKTLVVAPPTILKLAKNRFYWVGARTPEIVERWRSIFPLQNWAKQRNAPFFWGIEAEEEKVHKMIEEHFSDIPNLAIVENRSLELLKRLPMINTILEQTIESDRTEFIFPHNAQIEHFVFRRNKWAFISDNQRSEGLYRFKTGHQYIYVWITRYGKRISLNSEPEISAARWTTIQSGSSTYPVQFVPTSNRLEVAIKERLPFFIERALHLFSGRIADWGGNKKRHHHCDQAHATEIDRILRSY